MDILKPGTKYHKMSQLQKEILIELCKEDLSQTSLVKRLDRFYPNINDAVKILFKKNYIKETRSKKGIGKPERFYAPNTKKIGKILEEDFGLEGFWELVFLFAENNTENSSSVIDKIFENHQKKYFGSSKDLIVPLFDKVISDSNNIKKYSEEYNITIKILKMLANEKLNSKQITKKLNVPKSKITRYYNKNGKNPGWINIMISVLLIEKVSTCSSRYRLTNLGIVFLFDGLYHEITNKSIKEFELDMIIDVIKSKYESHYPVILKNWEVLKKILGNRKLIYLFRQILNFEDLLSTRMQNGGLYEFFNTLYSMRKTYIKKLENELQVGKKTWEKFSSKYFESEKVDSLINDAILRRSNVKIKSKESDKWNNILDKIVDLIIEASSFDIVQKQHPDREIQEDECRIQVRSENWVNLITMQFFTLVRYNVKIKLDLLLFQKSHQKEDSDMSTEIHDIKKNWDLFLENNKDYLELYKHQISQIMSFENKNIRLIEKLGEFSIESHDMMEQDYDLLSQIIQK